MKTVSAKPSEIKKEWCLIDAEGIVLGRLAAFVASRLRGKHKAIFSSNIDCGDNIIIINTKKVRMTGNKHQNKLHYRHTGFPGGIKEQTYGSMLQSENPEKVLMLAIKRMMPKGTLGRQQIKKLYLYSDEEHPHSGQKPNVVELEKFNKKNKRGEEIVK